MARKCWFKGNKRCTNWSWNTQRNQREDKKKNKISLIGRDKRQTQEEKKKKKKNVLIEEIPSKTRKVGGKQRFKRVEGKKFPWRCLQWKTR